MSDNLAPDRLVDDSAGFEMHSAVGRDADAIQLSRNVSAQRLVGEARTKGLQLIHHVVRLLGTFMGGDEAVGVDKIQLGLLGHLHAISGNSVRSLTRARAF